MSNTPATAPGRPAAPPGLRYGLTILVSLAAGYVMGYRATTGVLSVTAACLLTLAFAGCLCRVTIWLGMIVREPGTVQGFGMLALFPLTFGSSMFARADTMPGWLQAWIDVNPVSYLTDTVRALLTGGPAPGGRSWP